MHYIPTLQYPFSSTGTSCVLKIAVQTVITTISRIEVVPVLVGTIGEDIHIDIIYYKHRGNCSLRNGSCCDKLAWMTNCCVVNGLMVSSAEGETAEEILCLIVVVRKVYCSRINSGIIFLLRRRESVHVLLIMGIWFFCYICDCSRSCFGYTDGRSIRMRDSELG